MALLLPVTLNAHSCDSHCAPPASYRPTIVLGNDRGRWNRYGEGEFGDRQFRNRKLSIGHISEFSRLSNKASRSNYGFLRLTVGNGGTGSFVVGSGGNGIGAFVGNGGTGRGTVVGIGGIGRGIVVGIGGIGRRGRSAAQYIRIDLAFAIRGWTWFLELFA